MQQTERYGPPLVTECEPAMRDKLVEALKQAQKSQDKRTVSILRLIQAAIKDRDIAHRGAGKDPVGDAEVLKILAKMVRQRKDSARAFEEGNRLELAEQERAEVEIIRRFLPQQLCEEDVKAACAKIVDETGADGLRDMGKCMNALKRKYPGRMDFGKASSIVKGLLR